MEPIDQICANCSHWKIDLDRARPKGAFDPDGPWGYCAKAEYRAFYATSSPYEVDPTSTAIAEDSDEYEARLQTHATHGCRMWQPKPT